MKLSSFGASLYLLMCGLFDSLFSWVHLRRHIRNKRAFVCLIQILLASFGLLWGLSMAIEETRACAKLGDAAMIYWNRAAFHYFDQKLAVLDAVELAPGHFTLAYKDELKAVVYRMLYKYALLLPVIVGCFLALSQWYQRLSDLTFIHTKKLDLDSISKYSDVVEDRYSTAMVVVCTLLIQLYSNAVPIMADFAFNIPTGRLGFLIQYPRVWYTTVWILKWLARMGGVFNQCMLYAWYFYNYHWITLGVSAGSRLDILERRWEYFIGFAAPVVFFLRLYNDDFVVNYAIYAFSLPVMIISSNTCDYNRGYKALTTVLEASLDPSNPINDPAKRDIFSEQFFMLMFTARRNTKRYLDGCQKTLPGTEHVHVDRIFKRVHTFRTPNKLTIALLRLSRQPGRDLRVPSVSRSSRSKESHEPAIPLQRSSTVEDDGKDGRRRVGEYKLKRS